MGTVLLTVYVLIWPVIVACVLFFLVRGFIKDWRTAREEGRPLI